MKQLTCEMCGGTIKFKQDATIGVCDSCGSKYTIEEAKKIMEESIIKKNSPVKGVAKENNTNKNSLSNQVENLYAMARNAKDEDNPEMAVEFYRSLTIQDRYNWEPLFYYSYFNDIHCDSLGDTTDSLGKVFYFIEKSEENADEKWDIAKEIVERIDVLCEIFLQKQPFAVAELQVKMADFLEKYFADRTLDIVTSYLKSSVANYLQLDSSDWFTLAYDKKVKKIEDRIKKMEPKYEAILPILKLLETLDLHYTIFPEEYSEEFWLAIKYHIKNIHPEYVSKVQHFADTAQEKIMQSIESRRKYYGNEGFEKIKEGKNKIFDEFHSESKVREQIKEYVDLGKRLCENNHSQNTNNINTQELPKDKQKANCALEKTNSNKNKQSKKKIGIIFLSVIAGIIVLIVAFSFFGNRIDNDLVGTWRAEQDSSMSITFKNNGDMIVRSENAVDDGLSYKIDDDTVVVTFANNDTETYGFVVEGDTLIFGEYYYSRIE